MRKLLSDPVARFRFAAVAEAWSWAGLLVGMWFKYSEHAEPLGVRIMGPVHGALFVLYLAWLGGAVRQSGRGPAAFVLGVAAAFPPFTTVLFERWLLRRRG